ncbi:MAG: signal peptidase II [Candidatus Omnitrophota bacterium]
MCRLSRDKRKKIALFGLLFLLDQLTKFYFSKILLFGESISIINNIFHITLVYNKGAAFGIFQGKVFLFIIVSILAIYLILLNIKHKDISFNWILILAGACGNLLDRLRLGYVVDFLDFRIWPVFNIADSYITIGIFLIILDLLKNKKDVSDSI